MAAAGVDAGHGDGREIERGGEHEIGLVHHFMPRPGRIRSARSPGRSFKSHPEREEAARLIAKNTQPCQ